MRTDDGVSTVSPTKFKSSTNQNDLRIGFARHIGRRGQDIFIGQANDPHHGWRTQLQSTGCTSARSIDAPWE
jgi:hypothetical protein